MYFSLIWTADGLQLCARAGKGLVSMMAHPMSFLELPCIDCQEQYLSHCCCNWTNHWDLESIFSGNRMTNPEKWNSMAENIIEMVSYYYLFPPLREMNVNQATQILFSCFFFQVGYSMGNWANQQIVTSFGRSIYDVHGDIKIKRKLKQWRKIWKEK